MGSHSLWCLDVYLTKLNLHKNDQNMSFLTCFYSI